MKKFLSVLLSLLVVLSSFYACFGVMSFAGESEKFRFSLITAVEDENGKVPYIDLENNIIYGFDIGAKNLSDYLRAGEGYYLCCDSEILTTGSVIHVTTEENNIATSVMAFEVVIFGELNGDGVTDVLDASLSERNLNGHITKDTFDLMNTGISYEAFTKAADLNGDGESSVADYADMINASVGDLVPEQQKCDPETAENSSADIEAQFFTGSFITPEFTLSYNGKTLEKGKDYTVTYTENKELGTAYVEISGAQGGMFSGTVVFSFEIKSVIEDTCEKINKILENQKLDGLVDLVYEASPEAVNINLNSDAIYNGSLDEEVVFDGLFDAFKTVISESFIGKSIFVGNYNVFGKGVFNGDAFSNIFSELCNAVYAFPTLRTNTVKSYNCASVVSENRQEFTLNFALTGDNIENIKTAAGIFDGLVDVSCAENIVTVDITAPEGFKTKLINSLGNGDIYDAKDVLDTKTVGEVLSLLETMTAEDISSTNTNVINALFKSKCKMAGLINEKLSYIESATATDLSSNSVDVLSGSDFAVSDELINTNPVGAFFNGFNGIIAGSLKAKSSVSYNTSSGNYSFKLNYSDRFTGTVKKLVINVKLFEVSARDEDALTLKFKHTDDFLYRIGNGNNVALSSLFEAVSGVTVDSSKVDVTVTNISGSATGTFAKNATEWGNGTIRFSGTGVVKVTAKYGSCKNPAVLMLEVVNAENATAAANATNKNIVLLNDASMSTISVSNGYSLYGNGFTLTNLNDVSCSTIHSSCGYVTLNNGTLDNVKIICPVFDKQIYYQDQASKDSSQKYTKVRSAIECLGNSKILNSYISGGRAAIFTGDGCNSLVIEDSTIYGGTFCNMDLFSGRSVTLKNVVTAMEPMPVTADSSKTSIGLGIVVSSPSLKLTLEGTFKQYNWVSKSQANNYLSDYSSVTDKVFAQTDFLHKYNGTDYINSGIAYMAEWDTQNVKDNMGANLFDNRTNKTGYIGRDLVILGVSGGVYSVSKDVALTADDFVIPAYKSEKFTVISPSFTYTHTKNNIAKTSDSEPYCTYSNGLITVGTKDSSKTLDFSDVTVVKDGSSLDYSISVNSDKATVNGKTVTFDTSVTDYTVTFTSVENGAGYNPDGSKKTGTTTFTWNIDVHFALLAYDKPVWNSGTTPTGTFWSVSNNVLQTDPDYAEVIPIYAGLNVTYYDKNGTVHTESLENETVIPTVSGSTATATLSNGCTLTISTTHDGYAYILCSEKVYIYKTKARDDMNTFTKNIKYTLTDPNGQVTATPLSYTYSFANKSPDSYAVSKDFLAGTYTEADSNGSKKDPGCFNKGTLITLGDGTVKPIEDITYGDTIRSWDFFTGEFVEQPVAIVVNHGEKLYKVVHTVYSDGTEFETIAEHGVFDYDLNKFVYITEANCKDYIGHRFALDNGNGSYKTVTMTDAFVTEEVTNAYSLTAAVSMNVVADGLITVAPPEDFYNWIEYGDKLRYDTEKFNEDVEKYGLYDYDVFKDIATEEMYVNFNGAYLKIAVEKGYFTLDRIFEIINEYTEFFNR